MITKLRIKNFKRYVNQSIDLNKKIIVLVGPNSSGKSSLLKAMLAFKQTFEDQRDHSGFLSNGNYVDLGPFQEYVNNHNRKNKCIFYFDIRTEAPKRIYGGKSVTEFCTLKFVQEEDPQSGHGRLAEYTIFLHPQPEADLKNSNTQESSCFIKYTRVQKAEESYKIYISPEFYEYALQLIPSSFFKNSNYAKISKALSSGSIRGLRTNESGMTLSHNRSGRRSEVFDILQFLIYAFADDFYNSFHKDLSEQTFALAALRDAPQRSSPRTDEKSVVGSRGENTVSVFLDLHQKALKSGKKETKVKDDFNRILTWVQRLKLTNTLEVSAWRDLVDLRVASNRGGRSDSIADIGVGFSQAFPILLQLSVMPDRTRIIMEQPELHLYPWAQKELGEIICDEANRGSKHIIIETHSEHIIRGIQAHVSRARVQAPKSALNCDDVSILYVDEDGNVTNLDLNKFGEFNKPWPPGFFDQGLDAYDEIFHNKTQPDFTTTKSLRKKL